LLYFLNDKGKNSYTYIHIVFVIFVLIFKFIIIYLLHVLLYLKLRVFLERKFQPKSVLKWVVSFICSINIQTMYNGVERGCWMEASTCVYAPMVCWMVMWMKERMNKFNMLKACPECTRGKPRMTETGACEPRVKEQEQERVSVLWIITRHTT